MCPQKEAHPQGKQCLGRTRLQVADWTQKQPRSGGPGCVQPPDKKQPDRRMVPATTGLYRQQEPYQNNTKQNTTQHSSQLTNDSTVQQMAGGRHSSAVLCTFRGRLGTAGGSGAPRSPLSFLYSEWSDQMCLPLELWCFYIRIMPHGERVRETEEEVTNAGFAAHAGSTAVQPYFIAFSSSKWLH